MALGGSSFMKSTTMLEQLLEEINFQRTKEMRQLMKDDSGFVVLQGTTYWTDLFVRHFLFQEEQAIDCDDLLFFVRKRHVKGSSRYLPKYETDVEVFRKDSKKLPIGDPEVDWEETVYLNLIVHQFEYTLTLAICTRTSPKELQVLKRHSQKVYASPSRRKMDTKGEGEEMTYPHICFMVDNFDEVFCDIVVRDGEMVCVELVAKGRGGAAQAVIFLGSIRYDTLTRVYESRQTSLSSKVAQRMSFGLLGGAAAAGCGGSRCEFVRMKGPSGKGHAEMAVSRPRGSGLDTPASEPANDLWDDWEEDPDEIFMYRNQIIEVNNKMNAGWMKWRQVLRTTMTHPIPLKLKGKIYKIVIKPVTLYGSEYWAMKKTDEKRMYATAKMDVLDKRRLSDPSANLTNYSRGGWRSKDGKSRSENEGLDSLIAGVAEVEGGDLRDARRGSASSARWCCGGGGGRGGRAPCDMRDVYVRAPGADVSSPACLRTVTPRAAASRPAVGPPPLRPLPGPRTRRAAAPSLAEPACEMACEAGEPEPVARLSPPSAPGTVTVRGHEELPQRSRARAPSPPGSPSRGARAYCTLPRRRGGVASALYRDAALPPRRTTPDGTDIYYWCDLPKRPHELDDGAYNPLWAMRGFTQTFHLWKEGKRAQSAPLNAYLTYVTLPWWAIAKDILDHREEPILTF